MRFSLSSPAHKPYHFNWSLLRFLFCSCVICHAFFFNAKVCTDLISVSTVQSVSRNERCFSEKIKPDLLHYSRWKASKLNYWGTKCLWLLILVFTNWLAWFMMMRVACALWIKYEKKRPSFHRKKII